LPREAINLSREVQELAREAGASGADQLDEDIQDFETMHEEYQLKDEVQELIAIITAVYTGVWHLFGGAAIYAAIAYQGVVPEYAARGIGDAWFSVFMVRHSGPAPPPSLKLTRLASDLLLPQQRGSVAAG
jgi:hypothetical protein